MAEVLAESLIEELTKWRTIQEVALHFNVEDRDVLYRIKRKKLRAVKKGHVFLIHETWLPRRWK